MKKGEKRGNYSRRCYIGDDGYIYAKTSNWIRLEEREVTKRSRFWEYCLNAGCEECDGKMVARMIAHRVDHSPLMCLEQFLRMNHPATLKRHDDEIVARICGYDGAAMALDPHPYYIEISECGEYVRLWEMVGDTDREHFDETMEYIKKKGYTIHSDLCAACPSRHTCEEKCGYKQFEKKDYGEPR